MKYATIRQYALALPNVTEEPHRAHGLFRIRDKIFVTVPPEQDRPHVFVGERARDQAIAMYPDFVDAGVVQEGVGRSLVAGASRIRHS
ncbi:MmcQ/YjbR family DNA-binding protein [Ideonella sp. DXS29W]|uniref:MmcQ/YjbR family DNA-binding protein n=1 Tax=Ideonella lacteola TaxID=2984193 RepID=A0ABU9BUU5_9BURK